MDFERSSDGRHGRAGLALVVATGAAVVACIWMWRSDAHETDVGPAAVGPAVTTSDEPVATAELVEPPSTSVPPEQVTPPPVAGPAAKEPTPGPGFEEKYAGLSKERLESALRDVVAASQSRAKHVLAEKLARGESEVVDRGLGTEADLDTTPPLGKPGAIAGRASGKTGSTAMTVTSVGPGEDPTLDSFLAEANWLREELAGNH